jgi:CubicO group peptidase (beta-lactamase class C family)
MQNLIRVLIISSVLCGCYATTDKYNLKAANADSLTWYPPTPPALDRQEFRNIYAATDHFYAHTLVPTGFNGAILVAKKGQIIYESYSGSKNLRGKEAIDSATSFHLASVSKTFTGMATLKLWEDGKLGLNDEVSKYLPGFPYAGVTIKTLLNHRSGLPNYVHFMQQMGWDTKQTLTNAGLLQFIIDHKDKISVGRPDRGFVYCNTNYALLALVIEKVAGMSYAEYLDKTFFKPLQMKNTFVFSQDKAADVLPSYNWKRQEEPFTFLDAVYGDKNIYSTPRDLLRWDLALTYGAFFRKATLDSAYSGYSFEKPGIKNYGLGWRMYDYPDGRKIIYHNGWWHGNNTVFTRLIQDSATVIVLGNRYNRRIYDAKKIFPAFGGYNQQAEGDE